MENALLDDNSRNTITALANDGSGDIFNVRINPITGALVCEGNITSGNTSITSTIPGGTAGSVLFLDIGGTLAQDNAHFFYDPINHRLALGHTNPQAILDILGTFKYVDGSQSADYVLISDASGNATWDNLATNSAFITNLIANNTFTTNLALNSNFYTTLATNNTFVTDLASNTTFITNISGLVSVITDATLTGAGTTLSPLHVVSGGGGSVTTVSVVHANGFDGTVANATTTPAITIKTDQTGILKGNGTAIGTASAGSDYVAPGSITTDGITMNTSRILGRTTAGVGAVEEITIGTGLSLSGGTLTNTGVSSSNKPKYFEISHLLGDIPGYAQYGAYIDSEVYITAQNHLPDCYINVEIPGTLIQTRDLTTDSVTSAYINGLVVKGLYLYVLMVDNAGATPVIYRYLLSNINAGGTLMTITGVALGSAFSGLGMTSDGTAFYFNGQAGNSANSNIISKYSLSGTTLTWVSNTTCGAVVLACQTIARDNAGNYYGINSTTYQLSRFDSTGTLLEAISYNWLNASVFGLPTILNWGNIFYIGVGKTDSSDRMLKFIRVEYPGLV